MKNKVKKGGLFYLILIAYRNIFRNLRRSILCIIAVALAVFLIAFMMSYMEGMISSAKKVAQTFESGHIKITTNEYIEKEDFMPLQYPIEDMDRYIEGIEKIDGVKLVTSRISSYATFTSSKVKHGIVAGVNFDEIENPVEVRGGLKYAYYNFAKQHNGLLKGRFPNAKKNECMIGYRLAKKMELIPPVLEKYEYEWLRANLSDEQKKIVEPVYTYADDIKSYKLTLFKYNKLLDGNGKNKLNPKELKQKQVESRETYLALLDVFMNINISRIPEEIGEVAGVLDTILIKDYQREYFLEAYTLNTETGVYRLNSYVDPVLKEDVLLMFEKASVLRIPLKVVSSQYSDKYYQPKLVGIFEFDYIAIDENFVLIPFVKMQKLASLRGDTQAIYVFVDKLDKAPEIKEKISAYLNNEKLVVKDWQQFPFVAMFRQAEFIYYFIYLIFIIVASFLIINTIYMVINERIKEIGMMGAIGMNRREIIMVFFLEAVLLSLFGSLTGVLMGGILTGAMSQMPISIEAIGGGVDFPTTTTIFISFSIPILVKGFLFGTILSSFCTIFPSLKSAFIEPVEALRR